MISQIHRPDSDEHHEIVNGHTVLNENDVVFIVAHPAVQEPIIIALLGEQVEMDWEQFGNELITRRILITKPGINGKTISQMQIRSNLGTNITRVNRAGVDLIATQACRSWATELQ